MGGGGDKSSRHVLTRQNKKTERSTEREIERE